MATVVSNTEQKIAPKLYRGYIEVQYTHADLTDEDGSQQLVLPGVPAGSYATAARCMVNEYITGGAVSAATIACGTTASPTGLLFSIDAFDGVTLGEWNYSASTNTSSGFGAAVQDASPLGTRVNTTSDDVDNATTGEWVVGFWYDRVED